jgi:hypothetical protein
MIVTRPLELHVVFLPLRVTVGMKSRKMAWGENVTHMGAKRNKCWGLVGKPKGKRPLGRPRNAWVDDTNMDPKGIGCQVGELLYLAEERNAWRAVVNVAVNRGVA